MNTREGARRMKVAGLWLVAVPLTAIVLLLIVSEIGGLFVDGKEHAMVLFPLFTPLLAPGVLLWIGGWIVEGFGKKES